MFDFTGGVDVQSTLKAIETIKELGKKEYIAQQEAEKTKAAATVPTGSNVVQNQSSEITAQDAADNYQKYLDKYVSQGMSLKEAMNKLDSIIMKG